MNDTLALFDAIGVEGLCLLCAFGVGLLARALTVPAPGASWVSVRR